MVGRGRVWSRVVIWYDRMCIKGCVREWQYCWVRLYLRNSQTSRVYTKENPKRSLLVPTSVETAPVRVDCSLISQFDWGLAIALTTRRARGSNLQRLPPGCVHDSLSHLVRWWYGGNRRRKNPTKGWCRRCYSKN